MELLKLSLIIIKRFNSSAVFSLQSGDTIVIDSSSELSAFLADVASGALVITNQSITIDSAAPITVSQASKIDSLTTELLQQQLEVLG